MSTGKGTADKAPHFEMVMRVRDYEVDVQGIVNNANYLHYLEHTRHEFCREAGVSFASMHADGIDPVLRHVDITYINPLTLGVQMRSCLTLSRRGARFMFHQQIFGYPDNRPVVDAQVTVVCLENGRLTRGDSLAEAFKAYLSDDECT